MLGTRLSWATRMMIMVMVSTKMGGAKRRDQRRNGIVQRERERDDTQNSIVLPKKRQQILLTSVQQLHTMVRCNTPTRKRCIQMVARAIKSNWVHSSRLGLIRAAGFSIGSICPFTVIQCHGAMNKMSFSRFKPVISQEFPPLQSLPLRCLATRCSRSISADSDIICDRGQTSSRAFCNCTKVQSALHVHDERKEKVWRCE